MVGRTGAGPTLESLPREYQRLLNPLIEETLKVATDAQGATHFELRLEKLNELREY
jgi:hypothetical protein